ncbi:MAG: hypothetical protein JSS32_03135 [Verrucomicrobia bacterium]|nr:hypothetical protein [Verrucomicrobiota bacterium]
MRQKFPNAAIDWAVEESLVSLVASHPHVRTAIPLDLKGMKKGWKSLSAWKSLYRSFSHLRQKCYDVLFDLQGNCKSALVTSAARAKTKVGFGYRSVREKPNIFSTDVRFEIPRQMNIRLQHLLLVQKFFRDEEPAEVQGVRFKMSEPERQKVDGILKHPALQTPLKVMVCPGSKWANKQVSSETLTQFLLRIEKELNASFLLVWGAESEKAYCEEVHAKLAQKSCIVDRLSITTWQNLMSEVGLLIAVDSSALHLCGTTQTPSFSVFGPTSPDIFRPIGPRHFSLQGRCPYGRTFDKTCPVLRSCPTGACIRSLTADEIFASFIQWWGAGLRPASRIN